MVAWPGMAIRCWPFDVGCSMLVVRCWLFDVGCSMLVVRCWLFDVGCSMLVVRCWLFDVGCSMFPGSVVTTAAIWRRTDRTLSLLIAWPAIQKNAQNVQCAARPSPAGSMTIVLLA